MNINLRESLAKYILLPMCLSQTLVAENDFWNPHMYRKSATMQRRWTETLLQKTQLHLCSQILDVGCGDGGITAQLALEQEKREIVGVDISPKMIAFAKKSFPSNQYKNLSFFEQDAEEINYKNRFDGVVSFNTIHRITKPKLALQRIFRALKPGGHMAAVFPALGSKILSASIAVVDSRDEWKQYFKVPDRKNYFNTEETYSAYLNEIGFIIDKVQVVWEDEIFDNRQAFFNILKASYSQKDNLPLEKQDEFFNQIIDEYLSYMPIDHNGRVHFYFNRMEIIAYKPLILPST